MTQAEQVPESIGKYKVVRELGRGATGAVYLAEDSFRGRNVAIKMMFPEVLKDAEDGEHYRRMFLNEASLAGKIMHPHIVGIYDAVVDEKMSYIVMEYVEGGTLERFCREDSLLDTMTVAEIIFKCVRAMAFAFSRGLIHRDLKPGNILYKAGSEIKVCDFGAAMDRISDKTQVTAIGSPLYMSPEILNGAKATQQSDIYALGVVMYMLLSGRAPFEASSHASLMYQIANHEPDPPSRFRDGVSAVLEDIVKQSMAKDPARRYQSWEAFGKDLQALWTGEQSPQVNKTEVSDTERFSLLQKLAFFSEFPENELWEVLRISKWRPFKPGSVLIAEGDQGDSFFIIANGTVRVTRGKRLLNVLGPGDCIGEMSYLAKKATPRSASVTTSTDAMIMKIRSDDLSAASETCRRLFDRKFLETLVERLEAANQQLSVT